MKGRETELPTGVQIEKEDAALAAVSSNTTAGQRLVLCLVNWRLSVMSYVFDQQPFSLLSPVREYCPWAAVQLASLPLGQQAQRTAALYRNRNLDPGMNCLRSNAPVGISLAPV